MNETINAANENSPEAAALFDEIWTELETELGRDALTFPREIFWLNGAPGAGKGTQTPAIMRELGCKTAPIVISDLLQTPKMQAIKAKGKLVGDRDVIPLLFHKLVEPEFRDIVIVDGFPRTAGQVACLKLLKKKLDALHVAEPEKFSAPSFNIFVLFVSEQESIARQLRRGREMKARGEAVRETDVDPEKTRKRYRVFKQQTLEPLESLKGVFPYFCVEGDGSIEETSEKIHKLLSAR